MSLIESPPREVLILADQTGPQTFSPLLHEHEPADKNPPSLSLSPEYRTHVKEPSCRRPVRMRLSATVTAIAAGLIVGSLACDSCFGPINR